MPEPTHIPSSLPADPTPTPETIGETVAPQECPPLTPGTQNTGSSVEDSALQLHSPTTRASEPREPVPGREMLGDLGGRYEVLGEVGHGGMGAVWRGRDRTLGRELAIKVLLGHYADRPEVVQRFREEAQVGGQLQHPGVVPIYDLGLAADNKPYFTMKLVKGVTLAALLRQRSEPAQERLRFLGIFLQVCQAVAYAHSRGVIHRDLKPSNVMVGAFGEVQVMDWGLAKVLAPPDPAAVVAAVAVRVTATVAPSVVKVSRPEEAAATREGDVLGTPAYMPPEQALGELDRLDERCDVFSLGAVLCEILTGQPPYADRDGAAVLRRARRADLAEALDRLDACGAEAELTALARHCLAVDLAQRPRDAGEVAREVELYRAGVEERARQAELERAAALARAEEEVRTRQVAEAKVALERRARRLTVGLATVALLLVVAGGGGAWFLQQQHVAALARRQQVDHEARLTMMTARELLETGWDNNDAEKLAAALAEADKAVKVASSGDADDDVRQEAAVLRRQARAKVGQAKKNAALLAALLNVAAPHETKRYRRGESGSMLVLAEPGVEEQFEQAFQRWDSSLHFDRTPLDVLAIRLGGQPKAVVQEIVAGLDTWMMERRGQQANPLWQRLFQLADKLDQDNDRRKLRQLLVSGALEREAAVRALARRLLPYSVLVPAPPGKHAHRLRLQAETANPGGPVLGLLLMARALERVEDTQGAARLLRAVVTAQPDREVLLSALGNLLVRQGPWHRAEAIACYRAARAVRPLLGVALGKALQDAGQTQEAEALLVDLRRRQPNNPEMSFNLGVLLDDQKKHVEAEAAFRTALALKADYPEAHSNLGIALYAQKRYTEAKAAFAKALALRPDDPAMHSDLGVVLDEQGRYAEAEAAYRKALELNPNYARAHNNLGVCRYEQKRYADAETSFRTAIALKYAYPLAHSNLGNALRAQKRYTEAEVAYRKALELKPDFPEAHYLLGTALHALKRDKEAEAAYRTAIALKPDYPKAHLALGIVLRARKRYREAEAAYRQALALRPDYVVAYNNLGSVLADQRRYKEAETAFGRALALKPAYPEARANLGNALYGQGKYAEAETAYRKALNLKPDFPEASLGLAGALYAQKQYPQAEAAYLKALALKPGSPEAHCGHGNSLYVQGKFDRAEAAYRKAIALNPDSLEANLNLANMLSFLKKYSAAESAYRRAIQLKPDSPDTRKSLADVLLAQRRFREAVAVLRQAKQRFPKHSSLQANLVHAERLLRLDTRLAEVLSGKALPKDSQERFTLGMFCGHFRHQYVAAVTLFADAFTVTPKLVADPTTPYRYLAARYAALAAAGKGEDAGRLGDPQRARLRKQARDWLRADLDAYTALADKAGSRQLVQQRLAQWLKDEALAGVCDDRSLAALSEKERQQWLKLWADVAALLKKAQRK